MKRLEKRIQNFPSLYLTCSFLISKISLRCHYKITWTIICIDFRWQEVFVLIWCYEVCLMLWSLLLCLIISTVSELQLIAATYIWEYINENLFSVLFAIINTQKNFNHVTLDICKSIWSWKTLFCSIRGSFCSGNNKFCEFLNLWNFLFAKVTWRNVSTCR